jgi:hypothetical protein
MSNFMVLAELPGDILILAPFQGSDREFYGFLWEWWLEAANGCKDGIPRMFYRYDPTEAIDIYDHDRRRTILVDMPSSGLTDVGDWVNEQFPLQRKELA